MEEPQGNNSRMVMIVACEHLASWETSTHACYPALQALGIFPSPPDVENISSLYPYVRKSKTPYVSQSNKEGGGGGDPLLTKREWIQQ